MGIPCMEYTPRFHTYLPVPFAYNVCLEAR